MTTSILADFYEVMHEGGLPMVQFTPNPNRTVFRVLEMANQLQGLADAAALVISADDNVMKNNRGLVELGSQALESFSGSFAVILATPSGIENGTFSWTDDLQFPAGFALHQVMESRENKVIDISDPRVATLIKCVPFVLQKKQIIYCHDARHKMQKTGGKQCKIKIWNSTESNFKHECRSASLSSASLSIFGIYDFQERGGTEEESGYW